ARLIHIFADDSRDQRIASHEMMGEERVSAAVIGYRFDRNGKRVAVPIKGLRGARLPVILLHMTGLAIALEMWIVVAVSGPVGIAAVGPLCVGSFNGKSADPLVKPVSDR